MLLAANHLPTLSHWELVLRLGLAVLLGAVIGAERELREREAGLRTHMLVALGSALFTVISAYGFRELLDAGPSVVRTDPTRIAAQIVTGIGFLGAGAILRQGFAVRGLTTAATLWLTAAIGMAAGAGSYAAAVVTTAVALFALWPLRAVAHRVFDRFQARRIAITLADDARMGRVIETFERLDVRFSGVAYDDSGAGRTMLVTCELPSTLDRTGLIDELSTLPEVKGARWGTA